ncbi:type 1 glutamine amidotransferase [Lactobacillus hominis]|uniref:GMP synthase n=1 Tax=Lactobacillus hominis DSM 23910 = CRBIP 24.179 TaxID=1423758 RepID=I7L516_9LACO|nr:type 1 glutamine amidotransferase [Lactobacillus hominis]KRM85451.1 hypothetical protein FC41_GL001433 [Lactobacillus hominis DSM 23910 = CRBIP 24.179]MCT3347472.1 type 1 glutamine amidotransferase [Lactobacillus hominis]CCI81132.1 GMP synthase [Lactobacillus hominis DSM 23910 = CRBIP 24.179]
MRINVLQHTPNEGPGSIQTWAHDNHHDMYIYHPAQFGKLPTSSETDMLVILGGPMSPNDNFAWLAKERNLINELIKQDKPIIGICLGAQQIAKALGYEVLDAPHKEVGWAPVYLKNNQILDIPKEVEVLHWHQQMAQIPSQAKLLFSSDLVKNQGFILGKKVIGLQFHFEPELDNLREIVVNDGSYALDNNDLHQTPQEILNHGVPAKNKEIMFRLLDYISQ